MAGDGEAGQGRAGHRGRAKLAYSYFSYSLLTFRAGRCPDIKQYRAF